MALLDKIRQAAGLDTGEGPIKGDPFSSIKPTDETKKFGDIPFVPAEEVSSMATMSPAPQKIQSDVPLATPAQVSQATAPPSVSDVTEGAPAPADMPGSDLDIAISDSASLAEKEMQTLRTGMQQAMDMLTEQIKAVEGQDINVSELRKQTMESFGVTQETFQRISALTEQMAVDNANIAEEERLRDERIARVEEGGFTTNRRNAETTRIRNQAQRKMNPMIARHTRNASMAEALRGNVEMARSMTKDIVDVAVWDHQQAVQKIDRLFELKGSFIETMTSGELEILRVAREENTKEIERLTKEVSQKHELMIAAANNGVMLNIDPVRTSLDSAVAQYSRSVVAAVKAKVKASGSDIPTTSINIDGESVEIGIDDYLASALSTLDEARAAGEDVAALEDRLRKQTLAAFAGQSNVKTFVDAVFGFDEDSSGLSAEDLAKSGLTTGGSEEETTDEPGPIKRWWRGLFDGDDSNPTII